MASRGRGRPKKSNKPSEIDLDAIRDAEIARREYKTPQQIEHESQYVYGNDVFTVSRILAKRIVQGRKEYLIKWHGYSKSQATWEPAHNILDPTVVQKFEAKQSVDINVSREDVKASSAASSDAESQEEEKPYQLRKRKRRTKKHRSGRSERTESRSTHRRIKRVKHSEESEDESGSSKVSSKRKSQEQEENIDGDNILSIDLGTVETIEKQTPSGSISRDGDTSGEEIAEERMSETELKSWIMQGSFIEARIESVDKESDSSRSSNFSEIQDIVYMMTERVAMEIEGDQFDILCEAESTVDLNNNEDGLDVSHSIDIPSNDGDKNEIFQTYQAERAQGAILGSAIRSDIRVYLIRWSTGARQVLTHAEVKEKWPQLLIKFYESNIHWLKKLK